MIAGTIRNAVNQMQLVNDWEQKKATGDVVKKQEGMTVTSQEESMIQHFREQLERDKESSAYSQIYNKIASGQELTASEEDAIVRKTLKPIWNIKRQEWNKKLMSVGWRDVRQKKRLKGFK